MQTAPLGPIRAARIAPNTVNTRRIPIIFVPGIMGSRLEFTNIGQYWDPDSNYNMSHWLRISAEREMNEIDSQSPATVMTEQKKIDFTADEKGRGWEGVSFSSYGPFLRFIDTQKFSPSICRLYCVGYDWRQSNRDSGKYLIDKIEEYRKLENAKKVIILTHSMGGLVTRSALKQSSDLVSRVLGVVHVVHPAHGAVALYRRFFTGVRSAEDGGSAFATILGNTAAKFGAISSGLPGAMELLPTNSYRDETGGNWLAYTNSSHTKQFWTGNVYEYYRKSANPPGLPDSDEATGVLARLRARLTAAEAFHNWLGEYKLPAKTYSIYGTGVITDTSILFDPPIRPPDEHVVIRGVPMTRPAYWPDYGCKMQRPLSGDGTVPSSSGNALFPNETSASTFDPKNTTQRQFFRSGLEHEPAYKDSDVQQIVMGILGRLLTSQ
jgi:pimeloyl-ACP methyl ester carboxylesterase